MTPGVLAWLLVAAVSAVLFFGIAAVVSVRGFKDLRELLGGEKRGRKDLD